MACWRVCCLQVTADFIHEQLGRHARKVERSEASVLKLRHVQHIRHHISAWLGPSPEHGEQGACVVGRFFHSPLSLSPVPQS